MILPIFCCFDTPLTEASGRTAKMELVIKTSAVSSLKTKSLVKRISLNGMLCFWHVWMAPARIVPCKTKSSGGVMTVPVLSTMKTLENKHSVTVPSALYMMNSTFDSVRRLSYSSRICTQVTSLMCGCGLSSCTNVAPTFGAGLLKTLQNDVNFLVS